jgi:surface protein
MFLGTAAEDNSFNQDITSWNVSSVIDMSGMFGSSIFDQDISNWDVSNVIDMTNMFIFASAFNQDLNSWNISNVTECNGFSYEASAWTLPKPNFTNCNTGD